MDTLTNKREKKSEKTVAHHLRWKRVGFIAVVLLSLVLFLFVGGGSDEKDLENTVDTNVRTKSVQAFLFGQYNNQTKREVLGTVESVGQATLVAKNSGTIARLFVDIGDKVSAGQLLASYERSNDSSQINYENALSNLNTTKISAENNVVNAEIAYENALANFEQTKITESQTAGKTFQI